MEGKIKSFDTHKGYGYIEVPGREDVFLHASGIISGNPKTIKKGDNVTFMLASGIYGFQAVKARINEA